MITALLWGMWNGVSIVIITRADNCNVFSRVSNWKAKVGTASRLLRPFSDYLVEWAIEIIPRYVRSGRNFSRDRLSLTGDHWVSEWGANGINARGRATR